MNMHGLGQAVTKSTFHMQVDVGHIIPDPSKGSATDPEDYGWNLMAQPQPENVRHGHRTVPCEMAQRWCRSNAKGCSKEEL